MGRRQSPQPQQPFESQENTERVRRPQRRKHRSNAPLTKCKSPQHSAQETSVSNPDPPAGGRMEPKGQLAARRKHRDRKPTSMRRSKHPTASPPPLLDSGSDLRETHPLKEEVAVRSSQGQADDSDTDLSESERLPASSSSSSFRRVPPQLELRPEVIDEEDCFPQSSGIRGRSHAESRFPDFLPPPFNSWSLGQLAVFYNTEGRAAPRARPLERYLERLLQMEWRQIQTVQEESGTSEIITSTCQRSAAAASARLSTPKCILQCQRAFPLTLLSSLASHSTCSAAACHSHHASSRQSRLSPTQERGKRSYSESRAHSSDNGSRFSSSVGTDSYLRRMQASGNIRKPTHGAATRPHTIGWDCIDYARTEQGVSSRLVAPRRRSGSEQRRAGAERQQNGSEKRRSGSEQRRAAAERQQNGSEKRRSGSEQRRAGAERQQNGSEKRRSDSECRKGRAQQRRVTTFQEQKAKQDATALDELPGSKCSSIQRPSRAKQVEFVT